MPSCRLLNQPYDPADEENTQHYVIDGFILSPNVELISVEGKDLGFTNSDHNPILITIKLHTDNVLEAGLYIGSDGYVELYEDGSGNHNVAGYNWPITWNDNSLFNETGVAAEYTYADGHLSFGWEGGDGFYMYEYDFLQN